MIRGRLAGRALSDALAWGVILAALVVAIAPVFAERGTLGTHDWDQMEAHRDLMVRSLRGWGQLPFWNPYGCGGHPSWAGPESGATLVSPWLPAYLLLDLPAAIRAEVVGSTLLAALGCWVLAGRFTTRSAARAFVCVLFTLNSRWALQAQVGHTWHLTYAWLPWALFFFDRASRIPLGRDVVALAVVLALMVYGGAIYPLPQTALLLAIYALVLAARHRSASPLRALAIAGVTAVGLSAPKLVPLLDTLRRYPRLVESPEAAAPASVLAMLTRPVLGAPTGVEPLPWGWHEHGLYIGWGSLLLLLVGVLAKGARESALRWCALALLLLGFGRFHRLAPWALLHELPIFASQHVPSRWHFPMLLVLGLLFASAAERGAQRLERWRSRLEVAGLVVVLALGLDMARISHGAFAAAFRQHLPAAADRPGPFHQLATAPPHLRYAAGEYAPPALPAQLANVGVIECSTFPGLNVYAKDERGIVPHLGAKGEGERDYRGEIFTRSGEGSAWLVRFSPNEVVARVAGARVGDVLVLNQNFDDGWRVDGEPALSEDDRVGAPIRARDQELTFRYRPRTLSLSLAVLALTVGLLGAAAWRARRRGVSRAGT